MNSALVEPVLLLRPVSFCFYPRHFPSMIDMNDKLIYFMNRTFGLTHLRVVKLRKSVIRSVLLHDSCWERILANLSSSICEWDESAISFGVYGT